MTVTRNGAGCTRVAVSGEIDANSLDLLQHQLADHPRGDTAALVLDLSRVPFCSIGGVGVLLELRQRTDAAAVRLEVVANTRAVRRALERLPEPGMFSLHVDLAGALAAVKVHTGERSR